jgi:hypothetical protein
MVASPARIAANLANSSKSTGPKTVDGKVRSRANSTKHGLCSTVVVHPDDASALAVGSADATASPPAGKGFDGWLQGQVALSTVKLERCHAMELAVRSRVVLRASTTWDDDRRLEVVLLASKLAGRPEEVVARLRETYHGCEWLAGRWAMLAYVADSQGGTWTPEQASLAFDLMATPAEFRTGYSPGTSIDYDGKQDEATLRPADVARREIAELKGRLEVLGRVDDAARQQAEADLSDDDPELRRLRRYEAELHRRIKWAHGLLSEAASPPEPESEPAPEQIPTPEVESGPSPEPEPTRQASKPAPTRQLSRAERRLVKAESRREAKQRKLDRVLT